MFCKFVVVGVLLLESAPPIANCAHAFYVTKAREACSCPRVAEMKVAVIFLEKKFIVS